MKSRLYLSAAILLALYQSSAVASDQIQMIDDAPAFVPKQTAKNSFMKHSVSTPQLKAWGDGYHIGDTYYVDGAPATYLPPNQIPGFSYISRDLLLSKVKSCPELPSALEEEQLAKPVSPDLGLDEN